MKFVLPTASFDRAAPWVESETRGDKAIRWFLCRLNRAVLAVLLLALMAGTHAEDFGELEGSEHSPTFTAAERKHFIDAVARFKKHEIPYEYIDGALFWLDDGHLVFPSRAYPGWRAQPDEPPRLIVYDINSGAIRDSGYRGRLDCLNHLGDLILRLPIKPEGLAFSPESYRWFIGKWGEALQEVKFDRWGLSPTYICRRMPKGDPIHRFPPEELPPDAAVVMPLLLGHGVLRNTVARVQGSLLDYLHLVKEDGTTIFIRHSPFKIFSLVFQPWSNSYFENGTTSDGPASLQLNGEYKIYQIPRLLRFWEGRHVGRAGAFGSRGGVLWAVQKSRGLWKKQGVYLDTGKELLRIEEGEVSGPILASPNGCKVLGGLIRGNPFDSKKKRQVFVTDICESLTP